MKTRERLEARRIRVEEQLSLKDIAKRLNVSKGSVSLWVRDLPLLQETIGDLHLTGRIKGAKARADNARAIRIQHQRAGYNMARHHQNNPIFVAGCMMHWAEGAKCRNCVDICNIFFAIMAAFHHAIL